MKKIFNLKLAALALLIPFNSCFDDLDRFPTNDVTSEKVYSTFDGYKMVLAKTYGAYATVSIDKNDNDVVGNDGASTDFLRALWNMQELTTEEAVYTHASNAGIQELLYNNWTAENTFVIGLYYRCMHQITMANELIRESDPSKVSSRGISGQEADEIVYFRIESRFLRAFQYCVMMDIFGNPPFVDENTTAKDLPRQISRKDLFSYIEGELLDIENKLKTPGTNEYGRADRAACWALLARMYLNAEVYTGTARYTDAITYASKVIGAGYSLQPEYAHLFMLGNDKNNPEMILSINYDGQKTQGYGGLTYLINGSFINERTDDTATPKAKFDEYYGLNGTSGWFSFRAGKELYERFSTGDKRGKTYNPNKSLSEPENTNLMFIGTKTSVESMTDFYNGMSVSKYRNITPSGQIGSNAAEYFVDTDYPLFRLAEVYLIYAEAVLRGGTGGSMENAIQYMNLIRERAFGDNLHNYSTITLQNVLDERSRELFWECFRRTDLIRYKLYTSGSYLWQWKGGVQTGRAISDHLKIFPLPQSDITANPNLKQNPQY